LYENSSPLAPSGDYSLLLVCLKQTNTLGGITGNLLSALMEQLRLEVVQIFKVLAT
jgi:hypothetical protein